jgi:5'-deoxynucleotidase YfbR-like HD superfamily hydrolase
MSKCSADEKSEANTVLILLTSALLDWGRREGKALRKRRRCTVINCHTLHSAHLAGLLGTIQPARTENL